MSASVRTIGSPIGIGQEAVRALGILAGLKMSLSSGEKSIGMRELRPR